MAYDLPFLDNSTQRRLGRQVSSLASDAGHITDLLGRFTANARREAQHYGHDLADGALHQGAVAARVLGKQAMRAGRAVGRDPVPAIVAVAGLACLLTLVTSSGKSRSRRR